MGVLNLTRGRQYFSREKPWAFVGAHRRLVGVLICSWSNVDFSCESIRPPFISRIRLYCRAHGHPFISCMLP